MAIMNSRCARFFGFFPHSIDERNQMPFHCIIYSEKWQFTQRFASRDVFFSVSSVWFLILLLNCEFFGEWSCRRIDQIHGKMKVYALSQFRLNVRMKHAFFEWKIFGVFKLRQSQFFPQELLLKSQNVRLRRIDNDHNLEYSIERFSLRIMCIWKEQ